MARIRDLIGRCKQRMAEAAATYDKWQVRQQGSNGAGSVSPISLPLLQEKYEAKMLRARADTGVAGPNAAGAPATRRFAEPIVHGLRKELVEGIKKFRDVDAEKARRWREERREGLQGPRSAPSPLRR